MYKRQPVAIADEAYCVGPGPGLQSYLNVANIISAALVSGADAIHPGYGFLAENPYFAEICSSHGIKFIGPRYDAVSYTHLRWHLQLLNS